MEDTVLDGTTQLGMFGVGPQLVHAHVVAAHTRQLADGESVFVAEHLRWNRGGKRHRATAERRRESPAGSDSDQPTLFASLGTP
jgi:hypothetical protein